MDDHFGLNDVVSVTLILLSDSNEYVLSIEFLLFKCPITALWSDEETWPGQQNDIDMDIVQYKDKGILRTPPKSDIGGVLKMPLSLYCPM